jgi:hypothetical protein
MIRSEADARNEPFTYRAGSDAGTARILTTPPKF